MSYDKAIAKAFNMTDRVWERHANPLSGYTRFPILPLLVLAIWFRDPLGLWLWVIVAAMVAWTIYNPRAFPPPANLGAWMSRGVMGEKIWIARKQTPIPDHHAKAAMVLALLPVLGLPLLVYGLWVYDWGATIGGLNIVLIGKLWFLDRMVWLYDDTTR